MRENIKTLVYPDGDILSISLLHNKRVTFAEVRTLTGGIEVPLDRLRELLGMLCEIVPAAHISS